MKFDYAILCPMKEEVEGVLKECFNLKLPMIKLNDLDLPLDRVKDLKISNDLVSRFSDEKENILQLYRNPEDKNPIRVLIARIGIGRATSAYSLGKLLEKYFIKRVIVCGVAGACSKNLKLNDVVYNTESRVMDFNLGYRIFSGLSKLENENFDYSEKITYTECEESFFRLVNAIPACIATVDSFVYEEDKRRIAAELNHISNIAIDMESAHIYYLCRKEHIPCIVFRAISDEMEGEAESDFEHNLPVAAEKAAQVSLEFILDQDDARNYVISKIDFVKNFPKKGVNFLDIQSILKYPVAVDFVINDLVSKICNMENPITKIIALDARGFILGTLLSDRLNLPLVLARKKGKLPTECYESSYEKEYGKDVIQIEKSAISENDRVLIADDIAVTFGTLQSVIDCVKQANAKVAGMAVFATIEEDKCSSSEPVRYFDGYPVYSVFNF